MSTPKYEFIEMVDLTQVPTIYASNNPDPRLYLQYCIDFQPETIPTLAPFGTEEMAHLFLVEQFGQDQHKAWFPLIYQKLHRTCSGCFRYVPERELRRINPSANKYCKECVNRLKEF